MHFKRGFALVGLIAGLWLSGCSKPEKAEPIYQGRSASAWVRDLAQADYQVRHQAAEALTKLGPAAAPYLRRGLRKKDLPLQQTLLAVQKRFPFLRLSLVESARVRERAATLLGRLGPDASLAVGDLIWALRDRDANVAHESAYALHKIGSRSLPDLQRALEHRDFRIRLAGCRVIHEFGLQAAGSAPAVLALLKERNPEIRSQGLSTLGAIAPHDAQVARVIIEGLRDPDRNVRATAAACLGAIGAYHESAIAALFDSLNDPAMAVKVAAAKALWQTTGEVQAILPILSRALRDRSVRWQAAYVLGQMGSEAAPAVPELIAALKEEKVPRPLRTPPSSAFALGQIGRPAVPSLIEILNDERARVRTAAAIALGFIGPDARAAVPALIRRLQDEELEVRNSCALTLGTIDPEVEGLMPVLLEMLQDEDIFLHSAAANLLRQINPQIAAQLGPE